MIRASTWNSSYEQTWDWDISWILRDTKVWLPWFHPAKYWRINRWAHITFFSQPSSRSYPWRKQLFSRALVPTSKCAWLVRIAGRSLFLLQPHVNTLAIVTRIPNNDSIKYSKLYCLHVSNTRNWWNVSGCLGTFNRNQLWRELKKNWLPCSTTLCKFGWWGAIVVLWMEIVVPFYNPAGGPSDNFVPWLVSLV